jgi:hypothetical protein
MPSDSRTGMNEKGLKKDLKMPKRGCVKGKTRESNDTEISTKTERVHRSYIYIYT